MAATRHSPAKFVSTPLDTLVLVPAPIVGPAPLFTPDHAPSINPSSEDPPSFLLNPAPARLHHQRPSDTTGPAPRGPSWVPPLQAPPPLSPQTPLSVLLMHRGTGPDERERWSEG